MQWMTNLRESGAKQGRNRLMIGICVVWLGHRTDRTRRGFVKWAEPSGYKLSPSLAEAWVFESMKSAEQGTRQALGLSARHFELRILAAPTPPISLNCTGKIGGRAGQVGRSAAQDGFREVTSAPQKSTSH